MLERFIKLYKIIEKSLKDTNFNKKNIYNINKIELNILKDIFNILEIFLKPSIAIQTQNYSTIYLIYSFILTIREKLNNFINNKNNNLNLNLNLKTKNLDSNYNKELNTLLKNAINNDLEKLEKWFPIIINNKTINK